MKSVLVTVFSVCMLLPIKAFADKIDCESNNGRYSRCGCDASGGAELDKQYSDADCRRGYSWGANRDGVWVDHGCRGRFICYGGDRDNYDRPHHHDDDDYYRRDDYYRGNRNPSQDRCPSGFSPSEQKCTPQERQRGCKDIRLPSGLGCVKRR